MLSSLFGLGIFLIIGTVGSNFLFQTLNPQWTRKKHILFSSMLPPFALWLLVSSVLGISGMPTGDIGFDILIPIVVLAILLPFLGALFGIPTSWLILKQMGWKKSNSIDDIFG